jgi:hypothetical protein
VQRFELDLTVDLVTDVARPRLHEVHAEEAATDRLAGAAGEVGRRVVEDERFRVRAAFVSQWSEVRVMAATGSASHVRTRMSRPGLSTYSWT